MTSKQIKHANVPRAIKGCLQIIYEGCGYTREDAVNECITAEQGTAETHAWKEALLLIYDHAKIQTSVRKGGKLFVEASAGDVVGPHMAYEAIIDASNGTKSTNYLPDVLKFMIEEVGSRLATFEEEEEFPKVIFKTEMKSVMAVQMGDKQYSDVRCEVAETNAYADDEMVAWLRRAYGLDEDCDLSEKGVAYYLIIFELCFINLAALALLYSNLPPRSALLLLVPTNR